MPLVDKLLNTAYEDTQLLLKNNELGDKFSVARPVDFLLRAEGAEKAKTVCSFINDNQYGAAVFEEAESDFQILVTLHMPTTQNVLCSVSALMACLAKLFSVEYDGWGTTIQREA